MYRIRTIFIEGQGIYYNIDDLFPIVGINKEIYMKNAYEYLKNSQRAGVRGIKKLFNKYLYKEEIKGATGVQEHLYCHHRFFTHFGHPDIAGLIYNKILRF
jgi:hypothetical protein